VPSHTVSEQCVIRLRYNISTNDLGPRETANFRSAVTAQSSDYLNSTLNRAPSQENKDPAAVNMWSKFGLQFSDVAVSFDKTKNGDTAQLKASREYVLKNNPKVDIFGALLPNAGAQLKFQLAVNTAQYGRTFQDRTHKFAIRSRPAQYGSANIYNLQVKGKRGNIVQTYPGTEYDFHPNRLEVRNGDFVHFQWTGSNTNPNNNAGQGRQGSDRHNVVMLRPKVYAEFGQKDTSPLTFGQWGRSYPDRVDTPANGAAFLGLSTTILKQLATLGTPQGQFGGELSELDDAGTYFDALPQQVTSNGIYHYLCTRNNNFSNRGQKGKIVVSDSTAKVEAVGWAGATVQGSGSTMVVIEQGALSGLVFVTIENKPPGSSASFTDADSDFVNIQPNDLSLVSGKSVTVVVPYNTNAVGSAAMYYSSSLDGDYQKVGASFNDGKATTTTTTGGFFVVKTTTNWAAIIGITFAVLVVIGVATFFIVKKYKARKADLNGIL
jgi:plastocyanin